MPATVGDYFGRRDAGAVYGPMIVGWSVGGVTGPLPVAGPAQGKAYTTAFHAGSRRRTGVAPIRHNPV